MITIFLHHNLEFVYLWERVRKSNKVRVRVYVRETIGLFCVCVCVCVCVIDREIERESYKVKCRFALVFESSACSTLFYGVSSASEGHVTLNGFFAPSPSIKKHFYFNIKSLLSELRFSIWKIDRSLSLGFWHVEAIFLENKIKFIKNIQHLISFYYVVSLRLDAF